MRWLAVGIFTPLMRNHSALGTRRQELFKYENIEDFRNLLRLRYALIPYLYSEYMKAALKDEMLIRPLSFDYEEDKQVPLVEDQLMIGESIMITPVYTQNSTGRYVYLPEDMLFVLFKKPEEKQMSVMKKGHHYIHVQQNEVPVFIKKNHILPLGKGTDYVDEQIQDSLELISYSTKECFYELYQDDGFTKEYDLHKNITKISVKRNGNVFANNIKI
jgi:alpha-glucosidase